MPENLDKYKTAFKETFELKESDDIDNLEYQSIESWDSIGHMTLMSALETVLVNLKLMILLILAHLKRKRNFKSIK